ncbi:MAG: PH domain-containing protein [Acidimicrobiales bacterium]|nr:PH domain-containing protein [Acidimicrobiales bacterium]
MAFPRKLLNDTEEVVLDLNPHWWFMAKPTAALAVALIVGLLSLVLGFPGFVQLVAGLVILAGLAYWAARYMDWRTTNFVVTSDRLIYRHGVFTKKGIEIPLERVNNVMFSQTLFERGLGAGDLVIESAGESGRQAFSDVRKPTAVQNEIYRQIEANENRKFDRIGSPAGGGGVSKADELAKLDDLRTRGVLSEDEFAAEKRRLLDS